MSVNLRWDLMIFNYRLLRTYFAESFEHIDRGGERNLLAKLMEGTLSDRISKELDSHVHGQIEDCTLSIYLTEPFKVLKICVIKKALTSY